MSTATATRHDHDSAAFPLGSRAAAGAVSGLVAGIVFAMMSMAYAAIVGPGLWAPVRMIATMVGYEMGAGFLMVPILVGTAIHMMLSAAYGAAFGIVAGGLDWMSMLAAGVVFGLLLYVLNFELMTQFEQFATFRAMSGNWFEIAVHAVYGLLLAAGIAYWRTSRSPRHQP